MKNICVFGSSSEAIDKAYLSTAELLGKTLAEHRYGVIYGAGKYGVMGAVARGVRAAGGSLIGVSPDFFVQLNVLVEDYGELILTETMRERKAIMEDNSAGFIICAGGIGTLEEFFEVITLKQLKRHDKPIVILNTNGFYDPMIDMMEKSVAEKFMSQEVHKLYSVAQSVDEALEQLEKYVPYQYDKYK